MTIHLAGTIITTQWKFSGHISENLWRLIFACKIYCFSS
jgi:hypothetical protein